MDISREASEAEDARCLYYTFWDYFDFIFWIILYISFMYIVLEGIVGSGKTTQVKKLVEYFESVIAKNEAIQFSEFSEHGLLRPSQ
jgi:hypothetical protein